jgi:3-methyladenine DNA glycosylase AlkD
VDVVDDIADTLEASLRAVGTAHRAEGQKAYLKSDLDFTGTLNSVVRAEVVRLDRSLGLDRARLVALAESLWRRPVFERRLAAAFLLQRNAGTLGVADLAMLERLVRESRTWALVDELAVHVLGRMVDADPTGLSPVMDRWATDDDFWLRRSSLLAELRPIRRGAELGRFLRRAERMLDEREFFVRKAIGWVLREAGKRRPGEVVAWLAPRTHRASGVTMREAVKYLPDPEAARLTRAYRDGVPAG